MRQLLLSSVLAFTACGVGSEASAINNDLDSTNHTDDEIIGGVADKGDPAVVSILAKVEGKDGSALCTGTLISPTVVLTAAHCVSPATIGAGNIKFVVVADPDLTDGAPEEAKLAVKETHFDPQFDAQNITAGHDIAVVILAEESKIKPIAWNSAPLPSSLTGTKIRLVGYGLDDGFNQTGAGIKRQAKTKLAKFDDLLLTTGSFFTAHICNGDSGGPVLATINGVETVVGVNSFGFIYCIGSGNSTRVDTYASWVKQWL